MNMLSVFGLLAVWTPLLVCEAIGKADIREACDCLHFTDLPDSIEDELKDETFCTDQDVELNSRYLYKSENLYLYYRFDQTWNVADAYNKKQDIILKAYETTKYPTDVTSGWYVHDSESVSDIKTACGHVQHGLKQWHIILIIVIIVVILIIIIIIIIVVCCVKRRRQTKRRRSSRFSPLSKRNQGEMDSVLVETPTERNSPRVRFADEDSVSEDKDEKRSIHSETTASLRASSSDLDKAKLTSDDDDFL